MDTNGFGDLKAVCVNGTPLAYREAGAGEPVVFVHGGISDLRTWSGQVAGLSDGYRCIAYSRRFARPNPDIEPGQDDQLIPHSDDLAAFLTALGAAPAHLVGNSWGGFVCLYTAIRHPDVVRSLVLEEPPVVSLVIGPRNRPHPGTTLGNLVRHPARTATVLRFGARTMAPVQKAFRRGDEDAALRTFTRGVLGAGVADRITPARRTQMRENASALRAQMLGAGFPPLDPAQVRAVRVPALLVSGELSPKMMSAMTEYLAELLPVVERVRIPGGSHLMHEDRPDAVNAAIREFLRRAA
ncbi:alpha/beta fold hydrolase [Amycolatopsis thermophila]|uniref:Pimeloyl-ACP methyl ester carboxylesterase n=1 Tax=Amycolatopsis thermophila TaxID=206084 RepID=A0ABU0ELQ8_9PSEU|nr:alpha/beta hydrolase [Amycolatopsis thermophila]MDQ0376220.1 pimeloyl-ACP methyl ester carboxylesterase [Amycolatopsis thermophila]